MIALLVAMISVCLLTSGDWAPRHIEPRAVDMSDNTRAHHCLTVFNSICDDYNNGYFTPDHVNWRPSFPVSYFNVLRTIKLHVGKITEYKIVAITSRNEGEWMQLNDMQQWMQLNDGN